jgi:glycerol-3-phosphate dehydrogenase
VPQPEGWSAALTIPQDGARVSFAVPWAGMLLLGTTDDAYDGDPDAVEPTEADVAQVLAEAGRAIDSEVVAADRVRFAFAALRVLPGRGQETATARRETSIERGPSGMLSIAGGKLTTYRRIALEVLGHLRAELGLHRLDGRPRPLPGASGLEHVGLPGELPPPIRSHLLHLYGSLAAEVLAPAADDPSLLEPLAADTPDLRAQALYAAMHEWARTPEDVLRRRTTVALRGLWTPDVEDDVVELLARERAAPQPSRVSSSESPDGAVM